MATVNRDCNADREISKHTKASQIFPFQQITLSQFRFQSALSHRWNRNNMWVTSVWDSPSTQSFESLCLAFRCPAVFSNPLNMNKGMSDNYGVPHRETLSVHFHPTSLAGTYPEGMNGTTPLQSQPLLLVQAFGSASHHDQHESSWGSNIIIMESCPKSFIRGRSFIHTNAVSKPCRGLKPDWKILYMCIYSKTPTNRSSTTSYLFTAA